MVLDEDNRDRLQPKKKRSQTTRGPRENFTPTSLKHIVPPGATIALASSFGKCWGSFNGKAYARIWDGMLRAKRSQLEAVRQVIDILWNMYENGGVRSDARPSVLCGL